MPAKSPEAIARKNAKRRAKRAGRAEQSYVRVAATSVVISKTSAVYRRRFGPAPVLTKNELRAQITQAVLNTGSTT